MEALTTLSENQEGSRKHGKPEYQPNGDNKRYFLVVRLCSPALQEILDKNVRELGAVECFDVPVIHLLGVTYRFWSTLEEYGCEMLFAIILRRRVGLRMLLQ
jgi:hypothetical protein